MLGKVDATLNGAPAPAGGKRGPRPSPLREARAGVLRELIGCTPGGLYLDAACYRSLRADGLTAAMVDRALDDLATRGEIVLGSDGGVVLATLVRRRQAEPQN
jgi:hypothetical protein